MSVADWVELCGHTGAGHLSLDDQLQRGVGIEPVGARPVRHDEAGLDELAWLRRGMLGEPAPNLSPARVVFGGQVDVHACSLALPGCAMPVLN